jgi:protein O-GlcNAc transferase
MSENHEAAKGFFLKGIEALKNQQYLESEKHFLASSLAVPDRPSVLTNLAAVQIRLSKFDDAKLNAEKAIAIDPESSEALMNAGIASLRLGLHLAAKDLLDRASRIAPNNPEVWCNRGYILATLGNRVEAERCYLEALALSKEHLGTLLNYADMLADLRRDLEAEQMLRLACEQYPSSVHALLQFGTLMMNLARYAEARESFDRGLELDSGNASIKNNLGIVLSHLGEKNEARRNFRDAVAIDPTYFVARSNLIFSLSYDDDVPRQQTFDEANLFGAAVSEAATPKFVHSPIAKSRLRIGFVSSDIRNHPVGYFTEGLFANLDPNKFELIMFSNSVRSDDLTDRVRIFFQDWISIHGTDDRAAARLMYDKQINILIDLSGHSKGNRLPVFAFKPAPIQVSWLGYFSTTGVPEIDFFVGDACVSPPDENRFFTEELWNLADSSWCFAEPKNIVAISPAPSVSNGFITFGFFGNLSKMNIDVMDTWVTILHRSPASRLFIKSKQLADDESLERVKNWFADRGINGDRLTLEGPSPRAAYLNAYSRVDVILDTFPYPGGTTTAEAVWMGVPFITLCGSSYMSRRGNSIAQNLGFPDWVAPNREAYVDRAIFYGSNFEYVQNMREVLRARALVSPLFDQIKFARNFGLMLHDMWRSYALKVDDN